MRLGAFPCALTKDHFHGKVTGRISLPSGSSPFEFNNDYLKRFDDAGMIISGKSPDGGLVEMVELKTSLVLASQFHPNLNPVP